MSYTNGLDKPSDYFNTITWTGDGTTKNITGVGFQPDFVWSKKRNVASYHAWCDSVRGGTKTIFSNDTIAEETSATDWILSFVSDGFGVNSAGNLNQSSAPYVAWNWLAGGTASSNTDGSITSSVSANTTAGFSIVSWTANGTNGATIGHGLGVTPNIIIAKRRSAIGDWQVGGSTVNTVGGGSNKLLLLNTTAAMDTNSEVYQTIGSSTFQVGVNAYINTNTSTMIAYCFAEKKGFSKFGSYTGNGSTDGTFVYTGFKPAFIMMKKTSTSGNWIIFDIKRADVPNANVNDSSLYANLSEQEGNSNHMDLLSNGWKLRTTGSDNNQSGSTYIYMAFAESPFTTSTGIPATAR